MDDRDYILPDDYTEEPEETVEAEQVEDTTDTETVDTSADAVETQEAAAEATETPDTPFLVAKYNKAEVPLDRESAQNLAQLGMFYQEKIQPEFERLKGIGEQYGKMEQLAGLYGMTTDQLHETLYNQYIESSAESEGVTPQQKRKEYELSEREKAISEKSKESEQQQANSAMYEKFVSAYPDVKAENIKPETWQMVDKGIDLVTAYTMQLNKEYQTQLKQVEQIKANKTTSPAVATMKNGGAEPTSGDDFLDGLFGN